MSPSAGVRARVAPVRLGVWPRAAVWGLGAVPLMGLVWAAAQGQLGANPAEAMVRGLGEWALRFLVLVLAVTPLRTVLNKPHWQGFRRALGVWAGLYACLHLLAYVWLDQNGELARVWADVWKRPFIAVGMTAWVLLMPLLLTSFNAAVRALGGARWRRLHQAVYGVVPLVVLHFAWMRAGKNRYTEVAVYGAVLALLLGWRFMTARSRRAASHRGSRGDGSPAPDRR